MNELIRKDAFCSGASSSARSTFSGSDDGINYPWRPLCMEYTSPVMAF